jgi:serine/threonine protein kinase
MTTETASWIGRDLSGGRYRVTAKLGEGGMGFVYRARDLRLDCDVVVKVPRRGMLDDAGFTGRFAREIRSLVRLVHPHIVTVMDVGEEDGLPFAVMQYLSGGSLRDRQRHGADGHPIAMPAEECRPWLGDVAAALDFIHRQHYLHRDIKPENILFDAHGHVYLSDFGVAKVLAGNAERKQKTVLTETGTVLGTPHYMAPELLLGKPCDGRADQYALGVTVYELLSGRYPFDGPTSTAVFLQHTTQEPPPLAAICPSVPRRLAAAVQKALAKEPDRRFPDCASFAGEVLARIGEAPLYSGLPQPAGETDPGKATCPGCGKMVRILPGSLGKRVRCPLCGEVFPTTEPSLSSPTTGSRGASDTGRAERVRTGTGVTSVSRPAASGRPQDDRASTDSRPTDTGEPSTASRSNLLRRLWPWLAGAGVGLMLFVLTLAGISIFRSKSRTGASVVEPVPIGGSDTRSQPAAAKPDLAHTIAYWRFENGTDGTAASGPDSILDFSAHGLHGTPINGPVYRADVAVSPLPLTGDLNSLALEFNGKNQRVFIPDHPLFRLTRSLTVEAFIKVRALGNWHGPILFRGDNRTGLDPYVLSVEPNKTIAFHVENASRHVANITAPLPGFNQWLHVAGTLDDATGQMRLYTNGVLATSTVTSVRPFAELDTRFEPGLGIGSAQSSRYAQYFNGWIDEVRISDVALPPDQFLNAAGRAVGK